MAALAPGYRSPPTPRSDVGSPRPHPVFDGEQVRPYIKQLLASTLQGISWADVKDREKSRALIKEVGERVKDRMLRAYLSPSLPIGLCLSEKSRQTFRIFILFICFGL
jgi:hypothetical protein